jgi:hypothetical protein
MKDNSPISGAPISSGHGKVSTDRSLSHSPVTPTESFSDFQGKHTPLNPNSSRGKFVNGLSQLFGFKKRDFRRGASSKNIDFVKVDSQSDMRIQQGKMGKTFQTKMVGKLEELFDSWLNDTQGSYRTLLDREKRLAELEFAISNDPFLSLAADLYADEATQLDVQGQLIDIETPDIRMKNEMADLLEQWGVTQNRLRSVAYSLASYGDAFWANKVTKNGVVRINPVGIHEVKERLEFNPIQVQTELDLNKGYISSINRNQKLQALFDTIEGEENEEFADLFDTRLFGFVINDDMVIPPWAMTHFRLNAESSEYFPMGRSFFLKALAPFRQCNATMVLQSLARVMSFPVTVYTVKTTPGMDEAQQFDKVNEVREEYEAIGDSGAGTEAYSVNTKIWAPEGLLGLTMHSPNIDINATNDIQMYQDRVAIASGVPKGYLVQEWGGFGNSAISLTEQFKPFARRVFTVQSAVLDGLSNLFRLHFAITGKYDYRTPFALSMKFPNEESSDAKTNSRNAALTLSKTVLDTVANLVGAIDDPLPPEIIQDILAKFSFLDPKDIKKWIKKNPNQTEKPEGEEAEDFGGDTGGGFGGGGAEGGTMPGPEEDLGIEGGGEDFATAGGEMAGPEGEETGTEEPVEPTEEPADFESALENTPEQKERRRKYLSMEKKIQFNERQKTLIKRYKESEEVVAEAVYKHYARMDECIVGNRHYKFSIMESCMEATYNLFVKKDTKALSGPMTLREGFEETLEILQEEKKTEAKLSWNHIKRTLESYDQKEETELEYEGQEDDEERFKKINDILI